MKSRAGLKRVVKTVHTKHGAKRQTFWVRAGKAAAHTAIVGAGAAAGAAAGHALGQKYGARGRSQSIFSGALAGGGIGGAAGASFLGALGGLVVGGRAHDRALANQPRIQAHLASQNFQRANRNLPPLDPRMGDPRFHARVYGERGARAAAPYGGLAGAALGAVSGGYSAHQRSAARAQQAGLAGGIAGGSAGAAAGHLLARRLLG